MKITALTNGPLLVQGDLELIDQNGIAYAPVVRARFALCRCGGSMNKPFCDGTHRRNGFRAAPQAAREVSALGGALSRWASEGGGGGAESSAEGAEPPRLRPLPPVDDSDARPWGSDAPPGRFT